MAKFKFCPTRDWKEMTPSTSPRRLTTGLPLDPLEMGAVTWKRVPTSGIFPYGRYDSFADRLLQSQRAAHHHDGVGDVRQGFGDLQPAALFDRYIHRQFNQVHRLVFGQNGDHRIGLPLPGFDGGGVGPFQHVVVGDQVALVVDEKAGSQSHGLHVRVEGADGDHGLLHPVDQLMDGHGWLRQRGLPGAGQEQPSDQKQKRPSK